MKKTKMRVRRHQMRDGTWAWGLFRTPSAGSPVLLCTTVRGICKSSMVRVLEQSQRFWEQHRAIK